MAVDPLGLYNSKRDFARTSEPRGKRGRKTGNTFVVQKHEATRLHYDLRLEMDGVLKSWAVTRGPSPNPDDKRLAVRTEDHPLDYAEFEGTIPAGEYGGGTMMLWDRGTWESLPGKDPRKTIKEGHLHFFLHGERMRGEWLMIRLKPRPGEKRENWLLRKIADEHAGGSGDLVDTGITSISTGRAMAEIAAGKPPAAKTKAKAPPVGKARRKATPTALPAFRAPQLATLADHVPAGRQWFHEVKYDGYRCQIAAAGDAVRIFTRSGLDWTERFGALPAAIAALDLPGALIDGEIVALDKDGRPSFSALQQALESGGGGLSLFAFDLLEYAGEDISDHGNRERKDRLVAALADAVAPIHVADDIADGETLLATLCGAGYEGIVAKLADAPYRGKRSKSWLKVKCTRRDEFTIVGWSESTRGRGIASLLVAALSDGALHYAGKVGTGFGAAQTESLRKQLAPLARKTAPLEVPRTAQRGVHWVRPQLIAEVAFAETTAPLGEGGVLRHASFIGLRGSRAKFATARGTDKPAPPDKQSNLPTAASEGARITNPDRVIDPDSGTTKGELADYYAAMAIPILRFAGSRPLSLVRCPQGRARNCFFQKHDAGSFGTAVKQVAIADKTGASDNYLYVDDVAGLLACVQMGTIEFHGWGSRIDPLERPDRMVFDLDPDVGLDFADVREAARMVQRELANLGLRSDAMLSGGKGVHVIVALDATADWPQVDDWADRFARALALAHPGTFTANMRKSERKGRIFLDYLRNQRGSTAVMPWTVRARAGAPVAMPVTWEELDAAERADVWTIDRLPEIHARAADQALIAWGTARQALPAG